MFIQYMYVNYEFNLLTFVDNIMYIFDNLAAVSTGAGDTSTNSSIGLLL